MSTGRKPCPTHYSSHYLWVAECGAQIWAWGHLGDVVLRCEMDRLSGESAVGVILTSQDGPIGGWTCFPRCPGFCGYSWFARFQHLGDGPAPLLPLQLLGALLGVHFHNGRLRFFYRQLES